MSGTALMCSLIGSTALQIIPDPKWSPDRKWSPNWTTDDPERKWSRRKRRNGMEFGFLIFLNVFFIFIHFHQLNEELDKPKEKIFWRRKLWQIHFIFIWKFFRKVTGKIKARRQQYYFSTSSIYNDNSLMLPKLRQKSFVDFIWMPFLC